MKTSTVYLVIYHDIEGEGEYSYTACKTRDLARKEVQWYRENHLKEELEGFEPSDLEEMEFTNDFVSEAEYIHLVDTLTVQVEKIQLLEP